MSSSQKPTNNADDQNPKTTSTEEKEQSGSTTFDLKQAADDAIKQSQLSSTQDDATQQPTSSNDEDSIITTDMKDAAQQALQMKQTQSPESNTVDFNATCGFQLSVAGDMLDLVIRPAESEMFVGRTDDAVDYNPTIDLTPYGAYRLGISRKHAKFIVDDGTLKLVDLGSRNGTHINESPLDQETPCAISHGDLLQLGNMKLIIKFLAE